MKFTLTYAGELPSASKDDRRLEEKWEIRKQLSAQLDELWHSHPTLLRAMSIRVIPRSEGMWLMEAHHSQPIKYEEPKNFNDQTHIDLCASIKKTHPKTGASTSFRPLVRHSYALNCSLNILFMRREQIGSIYKRGGGGGDLDNRLKTLLDALSIPEGEGVLGESEFMYCLLEDDALVTRLGIDARRLLATPGHPKTEVRLVVDVDVRVTDARAYNSFFLGD